MSNSYSISLEGIRNAEQRLNLAARRIAGERPAAQAGQIAVPSDLVHLSFASPATESSSPVDYAAESLTIIEAKLGFEGILKVTTTQEQLDRNALDLLA